MLHILPIELSLSVLSYLPLQTLSSLPALSRQWFDFISANQSTIFHSAAVLHGYAQPGTVLLEDALSAYNGSPWDGAADWKDLCRRSFQLRKNWEGNGRVVARLVTPPGGDIHRIKVDEKAGICITTRMLGGLAVTHLFSSTLLWSLPLYYVRSRAHCEYENGYLIFDRIDGNKEVWRLVSDDDDDDLTVGGNECDMVASHAPPDEGQRRVSAVAATMHRRYAPRGHFRPWAKISLPETTHAYRFAYPTLLCANRSHAFLHDVRTGALVQTIDLRLMHRQSVCYVDVNERHAFVCDPEALHVYARHDGDGRAAGAEVLLISRSMPVQKAVGLNIESGKPFFATHPLCSETDIILPPFMAAHVSRDGRDLVIMASRHRVLLIRDFERICRGETSVCVAGQALHFFQGEECCYLAFEHGRVCVATLYGLFIVDVDGSHSIDSGKVVLVRPYLYTLPGPHHEISCMQLTDRRIYFTWEDARRRDDVPLFKDDQNALVPSSPVAPSFAEQLGEPWPWVDLDFDPQEGISVGCIDFSLMPES